MGSGAHIFQSPERSPKQGTPSVTVTRTPRSGGRSTPAKIFSSQCSRKDNILSFLGALSIFSVLTNTVFSRRNFLGGGGQYQARHYGLRGGLDNSKTDAAWTPVITRRDHEKLKVFRDKKLKRGRGETGGKNDAYDMFLDDEPSKNSTSHIKGTKRRGGKQAKENFDNDTQKVKKEVQSTTSNERGKSHNRLSFRPHPMLTRNIGATSTSLPPPTEAIKLNNRLVLLDGIHGVVYNNKDETLKLQDWLEVREDDKSGDLDWRSQTVIWDDKDNECVPMSQWQTASQPTCNSLHEVDMNALLREKAFSLVSSKGFWRNAWKIDVASGSSNSPTTEVSSDGAVTKHSVVLKSLKYTHDPNEEVFEISRVDAVSLDVLTQSRFTINIHGFCGSTSIQEFAGGDLKGMLPKLSPIEKLRMAAWVAEGISDIHAVDSFHRVNEVVDATNSIRNKTKVPPLIHNDINMDNVLLGYRNGTKMPIINDFNIAVFRKKNALTGEPCRFRGRFANPQWMSPEQQERPVDELSMGYLNEKIDVYALGNILYKIACGKSPWKYDYNVSSRITPELKAKIARAKLRGAKPKVPPEIRNSTHPSIKAVLTAMDRCYRNDAEVRPSAKEVTSFLKLELAMSLQRGENSTGNR